MASMCLNLKTTRTKAAREEELAKLKSKIEGMNEVHQYSADVRMYLLVGDNRLEVAQD
jgi:hypothetical protein